MIVLISSAASNLKASAHRPRTSSVEDKMPEDTEPDDTSILFVTLFLTL